MKGKCRDSFEKWYNLQYQHNTKVYCVQYNLFIQMDLSMQYGVIEDFFDEQKIYITLDVYRPPHSGNGDKATFSYTVNYKGEGQFTDRKEARKQAIEKAVSLYNER